MIDSQVIAHRFGAGLGPENTRAALLESLKLGVRWFECDVCLIRNDAVVIFHDSHLDRCTNYTGETADISLTDIQQLDAGAWFSDVFRGEKVLELGEALSLLQQHNACVNLELKIHNSEDLALVEQVHRVVQSHWRFPDRLVYSSFSHLALNALRNLDSSANIGHLFATLPKNWKVLADKVKAQTIHGDVGKLSLDDIQSVKDAGYPVFLYTINDREIAENLIAAGVDGVFTDFPNLFDQNWF